LDYKKSNLFAAVFNIISFEDSQFELPPDLLSIIETAISGYFPTKKFLSHHLLMNRQVIGAIPFNSDPEYETGESYSLYDLLFDVGYKGNYEILK
jgi:hypothetical protein